MPRLIRTLLTPGWRRTVLLRRAAAALLLFLAVLTGLRERLSDDPRVLVFTRAVAPGETLSRDDVSPVPVPSRLLPGTALREPEEVEGKVITAAATAGEVVTAARLLDSGGETLSAGSAGNATVLVPVRPAEPEVIPLLRHGDTVSVLTHAGEREEAEIVAAGGRVILADGRESPGTLLIGFPEEAARAVAAASLQAPLAVVLTARPTRPAPLE